MTDYKVTLSLPDSRPHERSQVTQLKLKVGRVVGVLAPPPLRRAMGGGGLSLHLKPGGQGFLRTPESLTHAP